MSATRAACSCCCSVSVAVEEADGTLVVSAGLSTMMGVNEDATDDGAPPEVKSPTMDELSSSDPGKVVSGKTCVET